MIHLSLEALCEGSLVLHCSKSPHSIILYCSPYPSEMHRAVDMFTFIVAGHETTGYSLSWILIEIARHPEVYKKIREELELKVPANTTHLSFNDISILPYLDMVIKEGMRLWPVTGEYLND